jgi:hypothetical protein
MLGLATLVGCAAKVDFPPTTATRSSSKRDPARMPPADLQQFVSINAAIAAAESAVEQTQLPTEPLPKRIGKITETKTPRIVIGGTQAIVVPEMMVSTPAKPKASRSAAISIVGIRSNPHESEADARTEALLRAGDEIAIKLAALDSPIHVGPLRPNRVWEEYVNKETARAVPLTAEEKDALKDSKAGANRVKYEVDVEISEPQLRDLRSEQRLTTIAPFAAVGLVAAGLLSLLFRAGSVFGGR